jgi:hypothetical protein
MNYSIDGPCVDIDEKFSLMEDYFDGMFESGLDVDHARYFIKRLDELKDLRERLSSMKDAYDSILEEESLVAEGTALKGTDTKLRRISLEVSAGMLNQSLLTLTKAKKLGVVSVGEKFAIETPTGAPFETTLLRVGNRLKERGRIGAFYEDQKVEELDRIILEEVKPKHWKLYIDVVHQERRIAAGVFISRRVDRELPLDPSA